MFCQAHLPPVNICLNYPEQLEKQPCYALRPQCVAMTAITKASSELCKKRVFEITTSDFY